MKNIIMCVDSFFQFIIAANLRLELYRDDKVDIVIYNSSANSKELFFSLRESQLFNNVFLADTTLTYCGNKYSFIQKFPKYFIYIRSLIFPQRVIRSIIGKEIDGVYDELIFNGDGALPECIFNACLLNNSNLKCFRIEDGYFSYLKEFGKEKSKYRLFFEKLMHKLFGGKDIRQYISGYFMSEPELTQVTFPYPLIKGPKISRDNAELKDLLNEIFKYDSKKYEEFDKKIVYFEDGASFFENNDEEVTMMEELARVVNKDSILVKRHPRRCEDRFAKIGIKCCSVNGVPWEVIQLNNRFDEQILISSCSGTLFNSDLYFGDNCSKILTYKLMNNPPFIVKEEHFESFVEAFKKKYGKNSIYVPENLMELKKIIANREEKVVENSSINTN